MKRFVLRPDKRTRYSKLKFSFNGACLLAPPPCLFRFPSAKIILPLCCVHSPSGCSLFSPLALPLIVSCLAALPKKLEIRQIELWACALPADSLAVSSIKKVEVEAEKAVSKSKLDLSKKERKQLKALTAQVQIRIYYAI